MELSLDQALGLQIKRAREYRSLSQESLSTLTGLSRAHLAQIEQGKVSPTIRTLEKIAQELGTSISDLVGEAEESLHE